MSGACDNRSVTDSAGLRHEGKPSYSMSDLQRITAGELRGRLARIDSGRVDQDRRGPERFGDAPGNCRAGRRLRQVDGKRGGFTAGFRPPGLERLGAPGNADDPCTGLRERRGSKIWLLITLEAWLRRVLATPDP